MGRARDAALLAVWLPVMLLSLPLVLVMERFCDPAVPEWAWHMMGDRVDQ